MLKIFRKAQKKSTKVTFLLRKKKTKGFTLLLLNKLESDEVATIRSNSKHNAEGNVSILYLFSSSNNLAGVSKTIK